ncbi:MAG: inner-rane translocator [Acidimicrobiales bacterium]|nr:inner-rane translocator [Acidimicrobiales bacterium]
MLSTRPRPLAGKGAQELALQLGAAALSVVFLLALLGALDYPIVASFEAIRDGALATNEGFAASLMQAVPVILAGVGVWFAYKVGLFNIGADGQLHVGGIAAFVVVANGPDLPGPIMIAAALVIGAAGGALWALIAGWLRVARGANEIISTIMLNFIAIGLGDRLISGALADPDATSPQTAAIPEATELGTLHASIPVGWAFVIAVLATAGLVYLMQRTGLGLRLRTIGLNPSAAERAGLHVDRLRLLSMALSGGVAGLAGGLVVLGMRQYLAPGWAPAWGFVGILVAFLAARFPALIPVWGVIFGMLATSAPVLKAQASVPDGIVTIIQVLPVLALFLLYRTRSLIQKGGLRWTNSSTR